MRSSLGAECAAFSTGLEHADMFRVMYGELCGDLCDFPEYQNSETLLMNDCKSPADALLAAGFAASTTSEDKRLGIELSINKQRLSRNETRFSTKAPRCQIRATSEMEEWRQARERKLLRHQERR